MIDMHTRQQEDVGVICFHLVCYEKHLFSLLPNDCQTESISSFYSVLVIRSLASSVWLVVASDWPYLSLTVKVTISVGVVERWQFD